MAFEKLHKPGLRLTAVEFEQGNSSVHDAEPSLNHVFQPLMRALA
jgi:hypothetical protein